MAMTTDMAWTLPLAGSLTVVRIGVLTSGGDCPGLNAVLRAVVRVVERVTPAPCSASGTPGAA